MSTLKISHVGSSKAYATCVKHVDKRPSVVIDLDGEYRGCFRCFSCGWHGKLSDKELAKIMTKRKKRNRLITLDWEKLNQEYVYCSGLLKTIPFNVSLNSVCDFGLGWDGLAYTFPMRNPQGQVIGIQRRFPDGTKCCVEGSSLGLFLAEGYYGTNLTGIVDCRARQRPSLPCSMRDSIDTCGLSDVSTLPSPLFICEGVSDSCSVYDLGFHAIGRASCQGQEDMIKEYLELYDIENVVIVADNDSPGLLGATQLQCFLNDTLRNHPQVYLPQAKDVRQEIEIDREKVIERLKGMV